MPYLRHHRILFVIGVVHDPADLLLVFQKRIVASARHLIISIAVKSHVVADDLRIIGLADLQPFFEALRLTVEGLHILEISVPVKFLSGHILHKLDCIPDLLCRVISRLRIRITDRHSDPKGGQIKPPLFQRISHQRAITGGIAMQHTDPDLRIVILNRHAKLSRRHGTHIPRHAVFLADINVMDHSVLRHGGRGIDWRDLRHDGGQIWETVHDL